jgi:nucleoside-triphosphatase THEP1
MACKIVLVVGSKNSGKTTYLKNMVTRARFKEFQTGGILCLGHLKDGTKYSYSLMDIESENFQPFASKKKVSNNSFVYGSYHFSRAAISWGNEILRTSREKDIIIFDEYGPLEELSLGFEEELDWLIKNFKGILVISVRPTLKRNLQNRIKSYSSGQ